MKQKLPTLDWNDTFLSFGDDYMFMGPSAGKTGSASKFYNKVFENMNKSGVLRF